MTIVKHADQLQAGDKVLMKDGSTVAVDSVDISHVTGGAQSRNAEGELVPVFDFDGNEVTVEYVDGEFSTFWGTDNIEVQS